uniref:Cytochrome c oxidase subunit 3 n=1 Tax=Bryozoa sp. TaxID=2813608 RepID=A0AAU8L1E2_9BILA
MSAYHLTNPSPWPLTLSISVLGFVVGIIRLFQFKSWFLVFFSGLCITLTLSLWWRDVIRESNGHHTSSVTKLLSLGMILYIVSEVMFFAGFFGSFFWLSLTPSVELGGWPPMNINPLNPYSIPLLNTLVLLSSGVSVTLTHVSILGGNLKLSKLSLNLTIFLGVYFTFLQLMEYYETSFTMADSVYGSLFFLLTGFHGIHVFMGTVFLIVCSKRLYGNEFSTGHHLGFLMAAWYWHFVDVIWLFLYVTVYWWGSL